MKKSTLFLTSDCNMFNSGSIEFIKRGKFVKNDFFSKTLGGLERPGFVHVYYHLMGGTDQYDKWFMVIQFVNLIKVTDGYSELYVCSKILSF